MAILLIIWVYLAKSFHLPAHGYGNPQYLPLGLANPYFVRFASDPNTSVLDDAKALNPTFFSLWIGNNDVLGYAAGGGEGDWITHADSVSMAIEFILAQLTATGAKGVIANLPDMMAAPYFTVMKAKVPYNGLVLTRQGQVDSLNFAYSQLGITFQLGQNPFIVEDAVTHYPRQMVATDIFLLTLPTDSLQCYGWGSAVPIPHRFILDAAETTAVNNAIAAYNLKIKELAVGYDLALVDVFSLMQDLKEGIISDGVTLTTEFVTGNTFSLDGIHLTQMGYAYIANQFVIAINEKYGSSIPTVSIANYPSVVLP
ncbi:MAG: SGNH/GDSL hydrolase family protein [Bacteroidales bacterium]